MLSTKSIKWMKNVSNIKNNGAYLTVDGIFNLHFPNVHMENVLSPNCDNVILLFQKIDNDIKLTHLVSPVDNQIYDEQNGDHRYYRKVKVLAKCVNPPFISRNDSVLRDLNFAGISQGNAIQIENIKKVQEEELLESIQMELFSLFSSFGINENIDYPDILENEGISDSEGRKILIRHYAYERSGKLMKSKKDIALKNNNLKCEVCGFDFIQSYCEQFIECHHNVPMNEDFIRNTRLEDLSLVCSNCHRMLHRKIQNKYLTCEELRELRERNLTSDSAICTNKVE